MKEETFAGRGGTRLFMRSWRPAAQPRAAVVLVHGVLAHSGQYQWSGEQLAAAGFERTPTITAAAASPRARDCWINDIAEYTDDLSTFIALVKAREPGLKVSCSVTAWAA